MFCHMILIGLLCNAPAMALRDPFQPNAPSIHVPSSVFDFSVEELQWVGTLYRGKVRWAFLRDPTGYCHRVKVGDMVGQERERVVSVSATEFRLTRKRGADMVQQLYKPIN